MASPPVALGGEAGGGPGAGVRGRGACEPERPREFCCGRMRAKYEKGSMRKAVRERQYEKGRKVLRVEGLCVSEKGAGLIGAARTWGAGAASCRSPRYSC